MKDHYINAIKSMIRDDASLDFAALMEDLKRVLTTRGHEKLLPSILRGLARELPKTGSQLELLVTNKTADPKKYQSEIELALLDLTGQKTTLAEQSAVVTEDKTLIGGFVLKSTNKLIDRSYKTSLLKLYRSITN